MQTLLVAGVVMIVVFVVARALGSAGDGARLPAGGDAGAHTVEGLMAAGRKIEAIKLYREQHRVGLKEGKEAVEAIAEGRTPR